MPKMIAWKPRRSSALCWKMEKHRPISQRESIRELCYGYVNDVQGSAEKCDLKLSPGSWD